MQYEKRPGIVLSSDQGMVKVRMSCGYACPRKEVGCSCGTSLIDTPSDRFVIEASDPIGVRSGQTVEVALSSSQLLRGVFIVFVVPLIGLFLGYLAGLGLTYIFRITNVAGILEAVSATIGFSVSLFVTVRLSRGYNPRYVITDIMTENSSNSAVGRIEDDYSTGSVKKQ